MSVYAKNEMFGVSTALTARATETHTANQRVSRLLLLQQWCNNPNVRHVKIILYYTLQDFSRLQSSFQIYMCLALVFLAGETYCPAKIVLCL